VTTEARQPPVCLDASLAVALALPEVVTPQALPLWQQWLDEERAIIVPPHFVVEVLSAVRRARVLDRLTAEEERDALDLCLDEILPRVTPLWSDDNTWRIAWNWALRLRRGSLYDPLYLAVAESVGAEFWTADGNLVRAMEADGQPRLGWAPLLERKRSSTSGVLNV